MEVRHQGVDRAEAVARGDEDLGRAGEGVEAAGLVCGALQKAQGRGADRDDPAAPRADRVEGVRGGGVDVSDLGVHAVLCGVLRLHRQEGAGADMQRDVVPFEAGGVEGGQQILGDVQAGGRRGDSAGLAGIDRLVVGRVPLIDRALARDVGGQRQDSERGDPLVEERAREVEPQHDLAALPLRRHGGVELREVAGRVRPGAEPDPVARREALGGPREGAPAIRRLAQMQHRLHALAGRAGAQAQAVQARRDHPRVVEDQGIARPQEARQVGHTAVGEAGTRIHHEQPRRAARLGGSQRDARLGQVEIEEVHTHRAPPARNARANQFPGPAQRNLSGAVRVAAKPLPGRDGHDGRPPMPWFSLRPRDPADRAGRFPMSPRWC